MVAQPPQGDERDWPDRSLAEQLVEQARGDGVDLVGPGGLLAGLTKQVLEAGLEGRWMSISATPSTPWRAATAATLVTAPDRRRCSRRSARSTSTCREIVTAASTPRPSARL